MHDDIQKIFILLSIAEKAREYPKLKAIHDMAIIELEKIAATPAEQVGVSAPVYPEGTGSTETDTSHVVPLADRRF